MACFHEGETKVGFGKKKTSTYMNVWNTDPGYIAWLRKIEASSMEVLLFQQWVQRMDMVFKAPVIKKPIEKY